jgi:hypothetical protein
MPLDKSRLTAFLDEVSRELSSQITLVAAGGTAMTLLDLKPSTIDVDFTGPDDSIHIFRTAAEKLQHGFRIDYFEDGMVFSQALPGDYLRKSILIERIGFLELRALHPLDIVVTKIGRLDERDWQDIEQCIRKFGLTQSQIETRSAQVGYACNDEVYECNVKYVIGKFFPK